MPPTAKSMFSLIDPVPEAVPVDPVPVNTAVHVAEEMIAGSSVSSTAACDAKLGPAFVTVIV